MKIEEVKAKYEQPTYLGDGVYASFDGYQIWLKSWNGNEIALEPAVFSSLVDYQARLTDAIADASAEHG